MNSLIICYLFILAFSWAFYFWLHTDKGKKWLGE